MSDQLAEKQPNPIPIKKTKTYYRIQKLSAFLFDLLKVEVDEEQTPPKTEGKSDLLQLVMGRLENIFHGPR